METLFNLSNLWIMPFWLLLISQVGTDAGSLLNPTLAGIAALLGTPAGATVGWVHFLAFDLFVGRWAYLDSRERKISAWLVSPTLFFILMTGPLGLLLYLTVRWGWQRRSR
jgi:hypothetical protein